MKFEEFKKLREKASESLVRCKNITDPGKLESLGYTFVRGEYCDENIYEHMFKVYKKGEHTAVFLETYVDREGGLYYQSLYSSDGKIVGY